VQVLFLFPPFISTRLVHRQYPSRLFFLPRFNVCVFFLIDVVRQYPSGVIPVPIWDHGTLIAENDPTGGPFLFAMFAENAS
jgi:hypothetical protein